MELTEDYLEADREIRGQNYVCLSFISPENVLKNKQMFLVNKFLQSISSEYNLDEKKVEDKYKDVYKNLILISMYLWVKLDIGYHGIQFLPKLGKKVT